VQSASTTDTGSGNAQPMVVEVDPNQTLSASPGGGVGVFTEYRTGGHWRVWWSCDTQLSGFACSYSISISVQSGGITNLDTTSLEPGNQATQPSALQVVATASTANSIDAISFDATPGESIELDAQVDGIRDGTFLFFVQNGKVNGGYQGPLTDPLILHPLSP
jgi:hypothetical protein